MRLKAADALSILALYEGAEAFRASPYGSRPWALRAKDGCELEGWREARDNLPGYSVVRWRRKKDALAARDDIIRRLRSQI